MDQTAGCGATTESRERDARWALADASVPHGVSTPLDEYRALVAQGPAVVMVARDDFLGLLDRAGTGSPASAGGAAAGRASSPTAAGAHASAALFQEEAVAAIMQRLASVEARLAILEAAAAPRQHLPNRNLNKWTDERIAELTRLWSSDVSAAEIAEALNSLPGEPITTHQVLGYAHAQLRLGRREKRVVWNPERLAYLRAAYERGDPREDILTALNAIPGEMDIGSAEAVSVQARKLGLKRSEEGMRHVRARQQEQQRAPRLWSAERDELLRTDYPIKTVDLADLARRITALGNREITVKALKARAWVLGLSRPPGPAVGTQFKPRKSPRPHVRRRPANPPSAKPEKWTEARRDLIRAEWPKGTPGARIAEMLNALPGDPIPGHQVSAYAVGALKLPRRTAAAAKVVAAPATRPLPPREPPPPAPPADDEPPPYDPSRPSSVEARTEKALAMLRRGTDPSVVQMHTRLPHREIYRLAAIVREERRA